ncbi:hypothetical protein HNQ77_002273 [Silvibacterium bohemicum]|uniref:Uncharacterized protein n=1 Tax=Silvibacterium bohemicum TaxID=1577686 RepID=A0A841JZD3_9BACT|nr:hypothetical protein [Silvibacterium bohemicum]MBB6144321.1 hypothetical protein [Silvibacterium bohemicum]
MSAKPSSNAGQGIDSVRQTRDEIKRRILQLQAQEQLSTNTVPT